MPLPCPHDARSLTIHEAEGHIGHMCESCGGVWLPRQYVELFARMRDFSPGPFIASLVEQPKSRSAIDCPDGYGLLAEQAT
jgi:hypothetical protein